MSLKKTVLIIGSGGREHALGWKFAQSSFVEKIYFAPGNGGTGDIGDNVTIDVTDNDKLVIFAKEKRIDLTFVGPEIPLVNGIVDEFEKEGLKIFGPNKEGAQLEGSKVFACDFMERHGIPYPRSFTFMNPDEAKKKLKKIGVKKSVIKANGLAAGKGVILPESERHAFDAIDDIMNKKIFGTAGNKVIIQDRIEGPEVSIIAFTDGKTVIPLVPSQDHKRIFDNDKGPNTGGMGAYAPVPFITSQDLKVIQKTILEPTIQGLRQEKIIYKGVLYAGLMMTRNGPKVLEYNVRFGDPETEPLMLLLDSDLYELSMACINGNLKSDLVKTKPGASVCVVIAAPGYPGSYKTGQTINGLNNINKSNVTIFHAGTKRENNNILTSGGRVLGITSYSTNIQKACDDIYNHVLQYPFNKKSIYFPGMHYRHDIGWQALKYDKSN
ncbi:phosphoribosylamine--glycine ligase [Candidatus Roizmanbacteria bacterium RIFCSPHIGHO2_02_FULL_37_13b]|uniref:Phosphoribosylamine--glycine ligase n=1 Tax=Candidatus Roizmanbacteria bacterium RIFCSPLOWO2_02_FULL_36_11 TaxID=1802071 RepID=A0A1F7JHP0_9BACT|nr:MAG: phosphoribosylamine--glycine ligase [Candidatus Roizmanbacteria bacterium RIFCSPHIGHO2_02_FULL_37_13b]OGK55118.1 MAG: phosphoribosylamine--glycine ligase [Candidatus Roizmanbacteria bacterium RIFCSPLOWO2_02_FULL_36_11]